MRSSGWELRVAIADLSISKKKKEKCIIRESNTGLIDGNDEFYH